MPPWKLSTKTRSLKRRVRPARQRSDIRPFPRNIHTQRRSARSDKTLYVSLHNGSAVAAWTWLRKRVSLVPVGRQQEFASAPSSHPSHMAMNPSGSAVYVAVENSDLVTVIDNDPASPRVPSGDREHRCPAGRNARHEDTRRGAESSHLHSRRKDPAGQPRLAQRRGASFRSNAAAMGSSMS